MPELPDIQVYCKNLKQMLTGLEVSEVSFNKVKSKSNDVDGASAKLCGAKVVDVYRNGKEIFIAFSNKTKLALHLKLNGEIYYQSNIDDLKHKIIAIRFSNGKSLALVDFRYLANFTIDPDDPLTPDALSPSFDENYFLSMVDKFKKKNVKAFLIDQSIIRGIGNAYADEILWYAKISPENKIESLPYDIVKNLFVSIIYVLKRAVDQIDKEHPDVIRGEYRDFLWVHRKDIDKSPSGADIVVSKIASKLTYYTNEQIMY